MRVEEVSGGDGGGGGVGMTLARVKQHGSDGGRGTQMANLVLVGDGGGVAKGWDRRGGGKGGEARVVRGAEVRVGALAWEVVVVVEEEDGGEEGGRWVVCPMWRAV